MALLLCLLLMMPRWDDLTRQGRSILLIEKQDDGRLCEPLVVADRVEQLHAFMHPVLGGTRRIVQMEEIILHEEWGSSVRSNYLIKVQQDLPFLHPLLGPSRKHSWLRRRLWLWLLQSSGSLCSKYYQTSSYTLKHCTYFRSIFQTAINNSCQTED